MPSFRLDDNKELETEKKQEGKIKGRGQFVKHRINDTIRKGIPFPERVFGLGKREIAFAKAERDCF